ncbi:sugar phosphate isomerase/epimerase [Amylibacter sp.]|nr:sugar phosphate isomerase/epimerase [Amylibacter sp.]|tara:strand:+ start:449 stop:1309 length:861 start_codon:yes stop_codon:yes gene_type:complete
MRNFSNEYSSLALNTATLGHNIDGFGAGWSPEKIIDACSEKGFGAITFWRREIGNKAFDIGNRVRDAGLEVCGLCRTPFLIGPMAPKPHSVMMDDLYSSIDMAAELGASCLTSVVGGVIENSHSIKESLMRVAEITAEIAPYANKAGVKFALEPLNPVFGGNRSCLVTVRDAIDICEMVGDPNVAVAIDVYHVWWDLTLPEQLIRLGGERIAGFHLCDWLADTNDFLLDRGMMGEGVADIKSIRQAVEDSGYNGFCEVEIFSKNNWWNHDPDKLLDTIVERFRSVC